MAATSASRAKFIASLKAFLSANNLDGVDIDWEYPCSAPRSNSVEISCTKFRDIEDKGGNCPGDSASLLALAKDMRAGLGDSAYISIASQAAKQHWEQMNLAAVTPYIDHWHVMTYDYTVSDIMGGATMSPNAPLYNPPAPATQMSISYSIEGYIAAGVPASKIMLGIPFYGMIPSHHPPLPPPLATHPNPNPGHTWYNPKLASGATWQAFGLNGTVQGACCGPFKQTNGAKPGKGSHLCKQCASVSSQS